MQSLRLAKVKELIKEEVSNIILTEIKDPRIGIVTLTDIYLSPDLRSCKIFVSTLGSDEESQMSVSILNKAAGYIRHHIKKRMRIKFIPEFSFEFDPSIKEGTKVLQLIEEIKKQDNGN